MKILLLFCILLEGCISKPICASGNDGFSSVLDPQKNCAVRIKKVIVGAGIELPKSISFKNSDTQWTYRWVESSYKTGILELGHFALIPMGSEVPTDGK